jgi:hypothetical protein
VDRHELEPEHFADQRREHRRGAAVLAREDRLDRLLLVLVGPLVEVQRDAPAAVGHDLRGVDDHDEDEVVQGNVVVGSLADLADERYPATLVIRWAERGRRDARAEDVAGAVLEVLAGELPGHCSSFLREARAYPCP